MEQQASNVWRKRAFSAIKAAHEQFGKDAAGADRLLGCLDTFRERVDHNVENTVPEGLVSSRYGCRCSQVRSDAWVQVRLITPSPQRHKTELTPRQNNASQT